MTRWIVAMMATGSFLSHVRAVEAQESVARVTELRMAAGIAMHDRRDLSASPMRFGGSGGDFAVGVSSRGNRNTIDISASGGARTLRSSSVTSAATERVIQGDAVVTALRTVGASDSGFATLAYGAALSASMMLTRHAYGDPSHRSADFVFGLAAIGPAVSTRLVLPLGALDASVIAPIAGIVDHAYSVVNERDAGTNRRVASLSRLAAATVSMSFTSAPARAIGITYRYRLALLRYDDEQPIRSLTQSFSVGMVARIGRRTTRP